MKNILLTLIAFIGLSSCKKDTIENNIKNDPKFATELQLSPESVKLDDHNLVLTPYLWRDFMPISEEDGNKMVCSNKLTESNGMTIPNTIVLKKQYLIKDNDIWTANYNEVRRTTAFIVEGIVRNGPKWGPNIRVDVVCEFEVNGKTYRILAESQLINRTD